MVNAPRVGMAVALAVALLGGACQGRGGEGSGTGSGSALADREPITPGGSGAEPGGEPGGGSGTEPGPSTPSTLPVDAAAMKPEEQEPPDPGKVIADLGAIPAWQAVVDRAQLLARRNQHGVVYGRIGPAILIPGPTPEPTDAGVPIDAGMIASPYVWLIDDTDGNGALGIRVSLEGRTAAEGDRVALGGAWELDADRRWYWKVDALQVVPPGPPSPVKDPPSPAPGHVIAMGPLPAGARPVSLARDNDVVSFQIVGPPPVRDGDGWAVADSLGDKPFALMTLPGERSSYGGQDMRTADERWQLKRGQTYWVRIGKVRTFGPDRPATMHARTAPVRVP